MRTPISIVLDKENELRALQELCFHAMCGQPLTARALDLADQLSVAAGAGLGTNNSRGKSLDITDDTSTINVVKPREIQQGTHVTTDGRHWEYPRK